MSQKSPVDITTAVIKLICSICTVKILHIVWFDEEVKTGIQKEPPKHAFYTRLCKLKEKLNNT
jgi:uncharacterized alkaline shock family protein YloU